MRKLYHTAIDEKSTQTTWKVARFLKLAPRRLINSSPLKYFGHGQNVTDCLSRSVSLRFKDKPTIVNT